MSTLQNMTIVFATHDDDKDRDTSLLVELFGGGGRLLARYFHDHAPDDRFPDPSTISKPMSIEGTVTDADAASATLHIHIDPIGHDTWIFDWHLNFTWGGSSPQDSQTFTGITLSQDKRDQTWALNILPNP